MTNGATLTGTGTGALVDLSGTAVLAGAALSMTNSTMSLGGPLAHVRDLVSAHSGLSDSTDLTALFFLDNSTLTSTGAGALLTFATSEGDVDGNFLRMVNGSKMTLGGPLFTGSSASFGSGTSSTTRAFFTVLDGSTLTSTGTSPLIAFSSAIFDSDGPMLSLRRSASTSVPSRVTLAGPLFSGTSSTFNTTTRSFGSTFGAESSCCSAFNVAQGAVLSSSTTSSLISLLNSIFTVSDSDTGGSFFLLTDTVTGFPSSELVSSSTVSLAGPLLTATGSTITPLFSLLNVNRSAFTSTTADALVTLSGSTVTAGGTDIDGSATFARVLSVFSANSPFGTAAAPASVALAGPLLSASASTITARQGIGIFGGASVKSTSTSPFVSLDNGSLLNLTTLTVGSTTNHGDLLSIGGLGGSNGTTFATLDLAGPLLGVGGGSTLNMEGALVNAFFGGGGRVTETHPTSPFVSITGGTHAIASETGQAMFRLFGRNGVTALDNISTPGLNTSTSTLTIGTDQPLQRSGTGAFFEQSGGTTSTQGVATIDRALLAASAPLINLKAGATLTTASNGISLTSQAKLDLVGPLVKVDASTLNIAGHALRALGGSFVNITGDLFSIANQGKINITNGGAILVSGNSVVKITGGLVNFTGTGNQFIVNNALGTTGGCSTQCGSFGSNILLQNSASFGNVSISSNAIKNSSGNTVSMTGAAIILDGSTAKLIISGN
jgi:hypothetical protein